VIRPDRPAHADPVTQAGFASGRYAMLLPSRPVRRTHRRHRHHDGNGGRRLNKTSHEKRIVC